MGYFWLLFGDWILGDNSGHCVVSVLLRWSRQRRRGTRNGSGGRRRITERDGQTGNILEVEWQDTGWGAGKREGPRTLAGSISNWVEGAHYRDVRHWERNNIFLGCHQVPFWLCCVSDDTQTSKEHSGCVSLEFRGEIRAAKKWGALSAQRWNWRHSIKEKVKKKELVLSPPTCRRR